MPRPQDYNRELGRRPKPEQGRRPQASRPSFAQRQAEASARAAAQQRRQQAARQSRIRQERARATEAQRQTALAAQKQKATRAQQQRTTEAKRRERLTIKKGDTADGIAARYGMTEQQVAQQTKGRLVAGQVLDLDVPTARLTGAQAGDVLSQPTRVERNIAGMERIVGGFTDFLKENIFTEDDPLGIAGFAPPPEVGAGGLGSLASLTGAQAGDGLDISQNAASLRAAQGAEITDRTRDLEIREQISGDLGAIDYAQRELGQKVDGMRYTHQALGYAWTTGDMSLRPTHLTQFEWENLTPDQKLMVQEDLGYVYDPISEVWIPQVIQEGGYGMGDYDYSGLGAGGGEYVPPRYTSSSLQIHAGGRVQQGGGRLTEGYIPASHWRI